MEAEVSKRLAGAGVRMTAGRRSVLVALADAGGPRSAAEIHGHLRRKIPLSSLYRSLAVLEQSGVLASHHGTGPERRYELAEWLRGHHHHLVCLECGRIEDVEIGDAPERTLHDLAGEVAAALGYSASGHRLEIEGHCGRCR